jgi:flagellin-like protein
MRSRRSISDIVAVVLLIVIAIAAAVIIYMWLSGLMGSMHTSTSATQVKLEITGASVTPSSNGGPPYTVTASVYNPPGSPTVSIATAELEFTNGTLICSTDSSSITITSSNGTQITAINPSSSATVTFNCGSSSSPTLPAGTPVEIVLVTSEGVQVTYTATVS